ncbi:DNA-binding transcriptional regulator, Lrp family [Streptomyces sp. KS_16]|nr:DNA-binding transcriptional regulator, Lrp family [Streptomyces sp. KS_16]SEE00247.1 DNA-binding transcriptional regulator, Lrp family [Streptomyces sp. 2133.1]SNC73465.1 DNA-binding transcriptional regulator, Lrp family [Streptomyces sp. 2114.4]
MPLVQLDGLTPGQEGANGRYRGESPVCGSVAGVSARRPERSALAVPAMHLDAAGIVGALCGAPAQVLSAAGPEAQVAHPAPPSPGPWVQSRLPRKPPSSGGRCTMSVDALDAKILRLLLEQPRTSVREYARLLGVARGTVQARLDRLERDGVITAYSPRLSPAALGHPVLAFVHIEVTQGHLEEVADALAEVPQIIEAFSTTGGGDLLTRVVARDAEHLEDVIQRLISLPGVVRTRTEVALRERVPHRMLPLVEAVGAAGSR